MLSPGKKIFDPLLRVCVNFDTVFVYHTTFTPIISLLQIEINLKNKAL